MNRISPHNGTHKHTLAADVPLMWGSLRLAPVVATAAAAGTGTKEYQAIKRYYAMLVNTLGKTVDPADFARKMGEKSLINDGEFL